MGPRCNRPLRSCLKHVLGCHHDIELASGLQALVCGLYRHSRGISHTGRWEIGKSCLPTDSLSCWAAAIAEGILDYSQWEGCCRTWGHRGSSRAGALGRPIHTHLGHSLLPPSKGSRRHDADGARCVALAIQLTISHLDYAVCHLSSIIFCAELVLDVVVAERRLLDAGDSHGRLLLRPGAVPALLQLDALLGLGSFVVAGGGSSSSRGSGIQTRVQHVHGGVGAGGGAGPGGGEGVGWGEGGRGGGGRAGGRGGPEPGAHAARQEGTEETREPLALITGTNSGVM